MSDLRSPSLATARGGSQSPHVVNDTVRQAGAHFLRCDCGTIVAAIQNGVLIVRSRHHGEQHQTVFSLVELIRQAREAEYNPSFKGELNEWPDNGASVTGDDVRFHQTGDGPATPTGGS